MEFVNEMQASSLRQLTSSRRGFLPRNAAVECHISSFSSNAGGPYTLLRSACVRNHAEWRFRPTAATIRAAASKQKKKGKDKRRPSPDKQWEFDELMLVWDDVFQKACENSSVASAVYELSRGGFSRFGKGFVLLQESVRTRPLGAASGFSFKSRRSSSATLELPSYSSVEWNANYVPKEFIVDPFKAPESLDTPDAQVGNDGVKVVDRGTLVSVLRSMGDRTRLLGLLSDPESGHSPETRDAGGEEPYDPSKDEAVIVLAVSVDGQQAVGADVLTAYPTVQDGLNSSASFWTLKLRDELPFN